MADYLWLLGPTGRCIFMEFKTTNGKQSDHQKVFQRECHHAGAEYVIHYSWIEAANYMLLLLLAEQRISQNMYNQLRKQLI